jgi:hypothetical protein
MQEQQYNIDKISEKYTENNRVLFTGKYILHPLTNQEIPLLISLQANDNTYKTIFGNNVNYKLDHSLLTEDKLIDFLATKNMLLDKEKYGDLVEKFMLTKALKKKTIYKLRD